MHWPFQSIATADTLSILDAAGAQGGEGGSGQAQAPPALFRRATWQPPLLLPASAADGGSARSSTLIPDYVVNFIRGETPETVARRKRNRGHQGMRAVDITHQHRPQRSHMALLIADEDATTTGPTTAAMQSPLRRTYAPSDSTMAASATTELRQMLPNGRAYTSNSLRRHHATSEKQQNRKKKKSSANPRRSALLGWRGGVLLLLLLLLIILIAGFVCLVVAGTKIAFLIGAMDLFVGSCATARAINWGLHAIVNLVVVVFILGANYVFQVLSSPTRSDVARAHGLKRWLEIGVPSLSNLRHVSRLKAFLALLLPAVAVTIQLLYNSVLFVTTTGLDYNLVAVKPSFVSRGPFDDLSATNNAAGLSREALDALQDLATADQLALLTTPACVDAFTTAFNVHYPNILLVLSDNAGDKGANSLVATARAGINAPLSPETSPLISTSGDGDGSSRAEILVDGSSVTHCLAQTGSTATCSLELNGILLVVVLGLNVISVLATAAALFIHRGEPLVTLGDAITSFLRQPDPTTRGNCLLTRENLSSNMGGWGFTDGKYWLPSHSRNFWFRAPSLRQWLAAFFWWLAATALVTGVLVLTIVSYEPFLSPMLSPFGAPDAHTTYLLPSPSVSGPALAMVASLPQILLAGLYFSVNGLLTAYFLTRESCRYAIYASGPAQHRLRVSADAEGEQATSLYLTLPRPVSWGLAIWFMAMGFVLSQMCFAVVLQSSPSAAAQQAMKGFGFSGVASAVLLTMLLVLFAVVGALGFLMVPNTVMADGRQLGNPLFLEGGSCSAVISARCHPLADETDVWKRKVCWGVVPEPETGPMTTSSNAAVYHATYSAGPVKELDTCHQFI